MAHQAQELERSGFELVAILGDRFSLERGLPTLSEPDARAMIEMDRTLARLNARASWGLANSAESPTTRFGSAIEDRYLSPDTALAFNAQLATNQLEQLARESSTVMGYSTVAYDDMSVLQLQETADALSEVLEPGPRRTRRIAGDPGSSLRGGTPARRLGSVSRMPKRAATPSQGATGAKIGPLVDPAKGDLVAQTSGANGPPRAEVYRQGDTDSKLSAPMFAQMASLLQKFAKNEQDTAPLDARFPYPTPLGVAGRRLRSQVREASILLGAFAGVRRAPLAQQVSARRGGVINGQRSAVTDWNHPHDRAKLADLFGNRPSVHGEVLPSSSITGRRNSTFTAMNGVSIDGIEIPRAMRALSSALRVTDGAFGSGGRTNGRWRGPDSINSALSIGRTGSRGAGYNGTGFDSLTAEFVNLDNLAVPTTSTGDGQGGDQVGWQRQSGKTTGYAPTVPGGPKGGRSAFDSRQPFPERKMQYGASRLAAVSGQTASEPLEQSRPDVNHGAAQYFESAPAISSSKRGFTDESKQFQASKGAGGARTNSWVAAGSDDHRVRLQLATITPLVQFAESLRHPTRTRTNSAAVVASAVVPGRFSRMGTYDATSVIARTAQPHQLLSGMWVASPEVTNPSLAHTKPIATPTAIQNSVGLNFVQDVPGLKTKLTTVLESDPTLLKLASLSSGGDFSGAGPLSDHRERRGRLAQAISFLSRQDTSVGLPESYTFVASDKTTTARETGVPPEFSLSRAIRTFRSEISRSSDILRHPNAISGDAGLHSSTRSTTSGRHRATVGLGTSPIAATYGNENLPATHERSSSGSRETNPFRVSVRLPDGSIVTLPTVRQSDNSRPAKDLSPVTSLGRTPVHIVLPIGGMTPAAPVAAIPGLVYAIQKRLTAAAVRLLGTDLGRAAALGVGETVVSAIRPFLDATGESSQLSGAWLRNLHHKSNSGRFDLAEDADKSTVGWRARPQSGGGVELELVNLAGISPLDSRAGTDATSSQGFARTSAQKSGTAGARDGVNRESLRNSLSLGWSTLRSTSDTAADDHRGRRSTTPLDGANTHKVSENPGILANLRSAVADWSASGSTTGRNEGGVTTPGNVPRRASLSAIDKLTSAGFVPSLDGAALIGATWVAMPGSRFSLLQHELPSVSPGSSNALRFADKMFTDLGFGARVVPTSSATSATSGSIQTRPSDMDLLMAGGQGTQRGVDSNESDSRVSRTQIGVDLSSARTANLPLTQRSAQRENAAADGGYKSKTIEPFWPSRRDNSLVSTIGDDAGSKSVSQQVERGLRHARYWTHAYKLLNPSLRDDSGALLPKWVVAGTRSLAFRRDQIPGQSMDGSNTSGSGTLQIGSSGRSFELIHGTTGQAINHLGLSETASSQVDGFSDTIAKRVDPLGHAHGAERRATQRGLHGTAADWTHVGLIQPNRDRPEVGITTQPLRRTADGKPPAASGQSGLSSGSQQTLRTVKSALRNSAKASSSLRFVDLTAMRHLGSGVATGSPPMTPGYGEPSDLRSRNVISQLRIGTNTTDVDSNVPNRQLETRVQPNLKSSKETNQVSGWEVDVVVRSNLAASNPFGIQSRIDPNWLQISGSVERGVFSSPEQNFANATMGPHGHTKTATLALTNLLGLATKLPSQASVRSLRLADKTGLSHDVLVRLERALDTVSNTADSGETRLGRSTQRTATSKSSDKHPNGLGSDTLADLALIGTIDHAHDGRVPEVSVHGPASVATNTRRSPTSSRSSTTASVSQMARNVGSDVLSFVSPQSAPSAPSQSGMDTGRIAKAAASSGRLSIAELPLIAPMAVAVTQQAMLNSEQDAKPTNPSPTVTSNGEKPEQQSREPKVNLDKLAIELANTFVSMSHRELERRGIWGSR